MKPFPRVLPCTEGRVGQDPTNEIGERCYIRKVMIMDTGQNRVGFGEPRTLGAYDPRTATSMKTTQKNRLRIL